MKRTFHQYKGLIYDVTTQRVSKGNYKIEIDGICGGVTNKLKSLKFSDIEVVVEDILKSLGK